MLSISIKSLMLSAIILSVINLNVVAPSQILNYGGKVLLMYRHNCILQL
jgi:hypothetical protein